MFHERIQHSMLKYKNMKSNAKPATVKCTFQSKSDYGLLLNKAKSERHIGANDPKVACK